MSTKKIEIYEQIGESWWDGSGMTDRKFARLMDEAEADSQTSFIEVHINSIGGSVKDGMAIYNRIKNSSKEVHTVIDGFAASMSFIIALAGKKVKGYKNIIGMCHNASGWAWGNAEQLREEANMLDKFDGALQTAIETRTGLSAEEVKATYMNYKDNFYTAQELLDANLIDKILDEEAIELPEDVQNMSIMQIAASMRKKPEGEKPQNFFEMLANKVSNLLNKQEKPTPAPIPDPILATTDMKITNKHAALAAALAIEATEEGVDVILEDTQVEALNSLITNLQAEAQLRAQLETERDDLQAQLVTVTAERDDYGQKAGLLPGATAGAQDPVEGADDFLSEADVELKRMRAMYS